MRHRVRWVAAVAFAVAVIAVGWALRHATLPARGQTTMTVPAKRVESAAAPSAHVEGDAAKARVSPTIPGAHHAHALPDSNTPLGEAITTLREYAEAGDTDAALELSWRLRACTEHALRGSEQVEQTLREVIESDKTDEKLTDEWRTSRAKNVERQIDERVKERQACEALPADLRAGWLSWVDSAAQSGNTAAMRSYARVVADQYYSVSDVMTDLDSAIERRDKARAYLDEALLRGDPEALRDIANTYRDSAHPELHGRDPSQAYAYAYAGTLAGISRGNDLDEIMSETAASLDGQQLAEAEAQGRRIYEKCCAKH